MIKLFKSNKNWQSKINFVDSNNVLIGFDFSQHCCENFGYYISKTKATFSNDEAQDTVEYSDELLKDYVFDKNSFEFLDYDEIGSGGEIVLTCIADGKPNLYMVFYNHHNGYYSHGFTMTDNGNLLHDISL